MWLIGRVIRYFAPLDKGHAGAVVLSGSVCQHRVQHFDASPRLGLNSLGISALMGAALMLCVGCRLSSRSERWQALRLLAIPFCVSSFSSLIKGQGFVLIFPPTAGELAMDAALCLALVVLVIGLRRLDRSARATGSD